MTIEALGKSDGIQNLKITNVHRHLLFDSMDPALLAGVDDSHDNDTSLAGVQGDDTSLAGVPIPAMTSDDDDDSSDTESNHNSIDPNNADNNSSKASIQSTGSQAPVHSTTDEPPQLPPDEEELDDMDNTQLPELETQVPILCRSKRVSVPPSNYIPKMGGKTYAMNNRKISMILPLVSCCSCVNNPSIS